MYGNSTAEMKDNYLLPEQGYKLKNGIVLIDDDVDFRNIMEAHASSMGIKLTTFESLGDMPSFAQLKCYDLALLDYYLDSFCGLEIAEYIEIFFSELPVILISGDDFNEVDKSKWPTCIRKFMPKSSGPKTILQRSVDLLEDVNLYRMMQKRSVPRRDFPSH